MATFKPKFKYPIVEIDDYIYPVLSKEDFQKFNTSLLGLGDISKPSEATDSIAAVFDLEGFTNFCKQIEPHLTVPVFLSEFLSWLFRAIRTEMKFQDHKQGVALWTSLPFFVKFMGDGVLVLWDVSNIDDAMRRNIVLSCHVVCTDYKTDFYPTLAAKVVEPPPKLRCGLARGSVFSVGNGEDYIGSCINMAARIQKLPGVTFAFNRRGIDIEQVDTVEFFKKRIVIKKVSIRGIGENELVAILKSEFDEMNADDRAIYRRAK